MKPRRPTPALPPEQRPLRFIVRRKPGPLSPTELQQLKALAGIHVVAQHHDSALVQGPKSLDEARTALAALPFSVIVHAESFYSLAS